MTTRPADLVTMIEITMSDMAKIADALDALITIDEGENTDRETLIRLRDRMLSEVRRAQTELYA